MLGGVTIVLGLAFVGLVPWLQRDVRLHRMPAVGLAGAPVLGVLFGLGWTPCIGPTLGAVLALAIDEATAAARRRARGRVLPRARAARSSWPRWRFQPRARRVRLGAPALPGVMRAGGAMLVVVGVLLVTGGWNDIVVELQVWVNGFDPAV